MFPKQWWTIPGTAAFLGWMVLGLPPAGASEIRSVGPRSVSDRLGDLSRDLAQSGTSSDGAIWPGDVETLGRRLTGLDPDQPLLDRLATRPGAGAALLPDDLRRPERPADLPAGLDLPVGGGLHGPSIARDPSASWEDVSRPTRAPELPRSPIPEPASLLLIAAGLTGLWIRGRLRGSQGR